jgi:hypothetical protein
MKSCPTCERTFDDTFTFCLADGALLSAPYDAEATQRITPPRVTELAATELPPTQAATVSQSNTDDTSNDSQPKSKKSVFIVGALIALAVGAIAATVVVVAAIFALNIPYISNKDSSQSNSQTAPGQNTNSATSSEAEALKDAFPQTVGDFTLEGVYDRNMLEGDDKFLPDAAEVMGAIYKSSTNQKVQVVAGSYASEGNAEAARVKRVPSSKYVARWTKGTILYVATNMTFKDKL